jgi:hypothetical protein
MKVKTWLLSALALVALAALVDVASCKRTDHDVVVQRPTQVTVKTTPDTLHLPTVATHTETVKTPVIGTQTETVVVKRPAVIGTKKTPVPVPNVKQQP